MRLRLHHALWLLSAVPLAAGAVRLLGLAGGAAPAAVDERFFQAPWPVAIHVMAAAVYAVLGALQFGGAQRSPLPPWHRAAGWAALAGGLATGMTGIWMTLRYPIPAALQGDLLWAVRLAVGTGLCVALVLAVVAARARQWALHRAWMVRAYAMAQGAGTQVLLMLPVALVTGSDVLGLTRDVLMSCAWLLNLGVAEYAIRARGAGPLAARP
ncbi:DUF2306 domain-containing protein [Ideonella sp.]|uniref:DUF2306 domain-containing protein n=1 Tax=Ideonella sp. TaxID=1929293 RepID=UPI0035B17216